MMGQMSQVTPPVLSTMADFRLLLELLSNPTETKRMLDKLLAESKALSKTQEEASKAVQLLQVKGNELEEKEKSLAKAQEALDASKKQHLADVAALKSSEKDLRQKGIEQEASLKSVAEKLKEADKLAADKESAASAKMEKALALEQKALALKAEYEAKLTKIKAAVGG